MAKFLITGAKGQVGYCLTTQLTGKAEILAVDRDELDITDRDAVFNIVKTFKPDVIINAAAHTAVDRAESEVELSEAINVKGPQYLAEVANEIGAVILHISTDYVFEGTGTGEYKEDDQTNPQGVYGRTKLEGEIAVQQANPRSIILRTAWVFGEHGHNFVKTMLRLAKDRDSLGIVGDQFGGPTYAGDIAAALLTMAKSLHNGNHDYGIYHFAGLPHVSWYQFATEIFTEANKQGLMINNGLKKLIRVNAINTDQYPTPAKRPANSSLNCGKIEQTFGIKPCDWQAALSNLKGYL